MIGSIENIGIVGMAAAVPQKQSDNELYNTIVGERRVKKQAKLTGIFSTHVSPIEQRTSDLCYEAAVKVIEHIKCSVDDIKVLIFASQTDNYRLPSTAFFLHKRLGLSEDCLVYDINLGCSAFNLGVQAVASHLVRMENGSIGLVLCGDICEEPRNERNLNPASVRNLMLFGSGGAAIALKKMPDSQLRFLIRSRGEKFDSIIGFYHTPTQMNGDSVFEFAINDVAKDLLYFENEIVDREQIDFFVLHQAQKMILDSIYDTCQYPEDKILNSYSEYGNTSGASIPISICSNIERLKQGANRFLMCGFGVGLSWAVLYADINKEDVLPIIYTNEHYDEDKRAVEYLWNKSIWFYGLKDDRCAAALEGIMEKSCQRTYVFDEEIRFVHDLESRSPYPMCRVDGSDISAVMEAVRSNSEVLSGIVFSCEQVSDQQIQEIINTLWDNKCLDPVKTSVILLDGTGDETRNAERLKLLSSNSQSENISFNMICVDQDSIKYEPRVGRYSEWLRDYVEANNDVSLSKAYEISNVVMFLVSEFVYYVNNTVLKI